MAVDTASHIGNFDATKPTGAEAAAELDDNLRHIKTVLKTDFAYVTGAVTASHTELSYVTGVTSAIQTQLDAKGAKAGQVWTGTHDYTGATINVATATAGDSSTKAASTAFVAATAFASALPAISSTTANKLITNDGTTARWADTPLITAESLFIASF